MYRYYRIRYGTADSNTSVAIPLIVGIRCSNLGYNVDMATPICVDHSKRLRFRRIIQLDGQYR